MKYIYLLLFLFVTSCHFNTSVSNMEKDRDEADLIVEELYDYLDNEEYTEAEKLFSEKFFEVTDRESLKKILQAVNKKGGRILSSEITDWNTLVVKGTNPRSEYILLYQNKRDIATTQERIGLLKEDDSIKIVSYHVTFDLLDGLESDSLSTN